MFRLFKQKVEGKWFVFWTFADTMQYTVVDPVSVKYLVGPDPQALIQELLHPPSAELVPAPAPPPPVEEKKSRGRRTAA